MSVWIPRWIGLLASLCIAGCQPGGGETSGIDGTGVRAPVIAAGYGRLAGGGDFVVNGITFDTRNMAVTVDDMPGTIADIAVGDVVLVTGTLDSMTASSGVAQKAALTHAVVGAVDSVDSGGAFLVALGQTVQLADTTYDASIPSASLGGLVVGDVIAVSGFRNERGDVIASRIAKRAPASSSLRATGRIANIDTTARRFAINALVVDYSSAQVVPDSSGSLAAGDVVEVSGTRVGGSGELLAERVIFKPTDVIASTGSYVSLEGYITALDLPAAQSFEVAGLPITTTSATDKQGALSFDARTAVKGALAADGTLVASNVQTGIVLPPGAHVLQGQVFDAYQGPLAHVAIYMWDQSSNRGGFTRGQVAATDSAGHFEAGIGGGPTDQLYVQTSLQGYFQPCAVTVGSTSDVTRNIELVSAQTLNALAPPPPLAARLAPTLTGTVYEVTPTGRQPLAGANVIVDALDGMGLVVATTQTDLSGHYLLCDWPSGRDVIFEAFKEGYTGDGGYITSDFGPVDPPQSTTHDFDLKKN